MVRSDEFFELLINLESASYIDQESDRKGIQGFNQSTLNTYNYKHNLPMERVEDISIEKVKDIFLEFFYLPIKPVSSPEIHFNFIDVHRNSGRNIYNELLKDLGENYTLDQVYKLRVDYYNRLHSLSANIELWLERLSKIRAYFKYR